jgi:hypothetical protein
LGQVLGEPHRELRSRQVDTMLLDQLGQPHAPVAIAALAADLKTVDPAKEIAEGAAALCLLTAAHSRLVTAAISPPGA